MIKLVVGKSIKLVKLKQPTLQQIKQAIKSFPNYPLQYTLSYLDSDGDQICINSDEELISMLALGLKTNKIFVKQHLQESIDMASQMTQKINPIFDDPQAQIRKLQQQMELKDEDQLQKPCIKWFLKPQKSPSLCQKKLQKPQPIIQAPVKSIQQNTQPQNLKKQNIQSNRDLARLNSSPSLQSNYLIYKKKQTEPKYKQVIDQPNLKIKEDNLILHQAICFNCKQDYGIIGVRYLCLVCDNFNLCSDCQKTFQHAHALLKIKTVEQTTTRQQITEKIKNTVRSEAKPIIPNTFSIQPISKEESNRFYLQIVQNYVKEGYQKSKKVFEQMITRLSGIRKNQNQINKPNIVRPLYTKTNEQKAASIQSIIKGDFNTILDLCQKNSTLREQELINLYQAQHN